MTVLMYELFNRSSRKMLNIAMYEWRNPLIILVTHLSLAEKQINKKKNNSFYCLLV